MLRGGDEETHRQDDAIEVISLGAGVQSTAMTLMAVRGELQPRPAFAIFADTHWEPKEVYEHLSWLTDYCDRRVPIQVVSAGNIRKDYERRMAGEGRAASIPFRTRNAAGSVGKLWRQCTKEYKLEPIWRHLTKIRKGRSVRLWIGISRDEAHRMKPSNVPWIENHYPLVDAGITRNDALEWLSAHNFPRPPRSACVICPFHSNQYWLRLKRTSPDEWREAVSFDNQIRDSIPGVKERCYIHKSVTPLDSAVKDGERQATLFEDFGDECEGMCGV